MIKNYKCEGTHCISANSEVRWLRTGNDSNAILCRPCFNHEMDFRRERNLELHPDCAFPIPRWQDLKRDE